MYELIKDHPLLRTEEEKEEEDLVMVVAALVLRQNMYENQCQNEYEYDNVN